MRVQAEDAGAAHGCDHIAGSDECGPDGDEVRIGKARLCHRPRRTGGVQRLE